MKLGPGDFTTPGSVLPAVSEIKGDKGCRLQAVGHGRPAVWPRSASLASFPTAQALSNHHVSSSEAGASGSEDTSEQEQPDPCLHGADGAVGQTNGKHGIA